MPAQEENEDRFDRSFLAVKAAVLTIFFLGVKWIRPVKVKKHIQVGCFCFVFPEVPSIPSNFLLFLFSHDSSQRNFGSLIHVFLHIFVVYIYDSLILVHFGRRFSMFFSLKFWRRIRPKTRTFLGR